MLLLPEQLSVAPQGHGSVKSITWGLSSPVDLGPHIDACCLGLVFVRKCRLGCSEVHQEGSADKSLNCLPCDGEITQAPPGP